MYYYISGKMGMTSSGSFTRDMNRWILFTKDEAERITKPYGATKTGTFVSTSKF
jgi:hypothetical protein